MKGRTVLFLMILMMTIGYAAKSVTVYINGLTAINQNLEDFNVYYSDAIVNGIQDMSVLSSDIIIEFTTTFNEIGEKYILDYEVTNGSKNYDANVSILCTEGNSNLSVTNEFDDSTILLSQKSRKGKLTIEKITENSSDDNSITMTCIIDSKPVERNILGTDVKNYVLEGYYVDDNETIIPNADLVIYSETPHYVTTDSKGFFILGGLEQGEHEVYYVNDDYDNIKNKTKDEIISLATSFSIFSTDIIDEIKFNNNSKIVDTVISDSISYCTPLINKVWSYEYTGEEEMFVPICNGNYKLEVWGARGGSYNTTDRGGYGGYSVGTINLRENTNIYINVGGHGTCTSGLSPGGYNGGGASTKDTTYFTGSGGGATHVAFKSGLLSTLSNNIDDIIIVAGGGGGVAQNSKGTSIGRGGSAGGYIGNSGQTKSEGYNGGGGGTQSTGGTSAIDPGSFGQGGNASTGSSNRGGGGGGGFFGGGSGHAFGASGGGGSSYIGNPWLTDKVMYCYSCAESSDYITKTISTTCGNSTATEKCAKYGDGYAKITYLG